MTIADAQRIVNLYKRGYFSRMSAIHGIIDLAQATCTPDNPVIRAMLESLVSDEVRERADNKLTARE
jgi:hypothetical protein